jgi:hypothetical protein
MTMMIGHIGLIQKPTKKIDIVKHVENHVQNTSLRKTCN